MQIYYTSQEESSIEVSLSMGSVSTYIAPAFYYTQVDLAGPLKAYTFHNKRKTIKIWFMCILLLNNFNGFH